MICPSCRVEMRQARKEEVIIDVCPQCRGVWLDPGELEKILAQSKHAMVEYDELYKFYDHHHKEHNHHNKEYDHHYDHKKYKKKHGVFSILQDIFD